MYLPYIWLLSYSNNNNWTEWSTIQGVIGLAISKSDEHEMYAFVNADVITHDQHMFLILVSYPFLLEFDICVLALKFQLSLWFGKVLKSGAKDPTPFVLLVCLHRYLEPT